MPTTAYAEKTPNLTDNSKVVVSVDKPKISRYVSLDFQRGLAVFMMIILHSFVNVYDDSWLVEDMSQIYSWPLYLVIPLFTVGFFASWNGYFLLISSVVNSIAMTKKAKKGVPLKNILIKQLLNGLAIILAGFIKDVFGLGGYFGTALRTGDWSNTFPLWEGFFAMNTLQIIGYTMMITSVVHFLLMRNEGHKKFVRNIIVYGILFLVIVVSSEFVYMWIDNLSWNVPPEINQEILGNPEYHFSWPSRFFQAYNASFKSFICTIIAGDNLPLFPYLASSFIGSLVGLCLSREKPVRRLPLLGGLSSLVLMAIGGLVMALTTIPLSNARPPIGYYLFLMSMQLGTIFLFLGLIEYRGKSSRFASRPFVRHLRLWGMLSLTLYCLSIFELLPRWIIGLLYNSFATNALNMLGKPFSLGQEWAAFLVMLIVFLFYEGLVLLWSKVNFRFSLEWFIIKLNTLGTKEITKKLNVYTMMHNVNWISCKAANSAKPGKNPAKTVSKKREEVE